MYSGGNDSIQCKENGFLENYVVVSSIFGVVDLKNPGFYTDIDMALMFTDGEKLHRIGRVRSLLISSPPSQYPPAKDLLMYVRCLFLRRLRSTTSRRLVDEGLVNVRNHPPTSDGSLDERVKFFVPTDGELQVTRSDALNLEVFGGVSSQLENFSGKVLQNCCCVHSSGGTNVLASRNAGLQETVDTSNRELKGNGKIEGIQIDQANRIHTGQRQANLLEHTWSPAREERD
jgi:hypothetical protein